MASNRNFPGHEDQLENHFNSHKQPDGKTYRQRTKSAVVPRRFDPRNTGTPSRRTSHDVHGTHERIFLIDVEGVLNHMNNIEDTDRNGMVTIDDDGPKRITVGTWTSNGYRRTDICGHYLIANLLQEATIAKGLGYSVIKLPESWLRENHVARLRRMVKTQFWPGLTRRIDGANIAQVGKDEKDRSGNARARVYVPRGAPKQYAYYKRIAGKEEAMAKSSAMAKAKAKAMAKNEDDKEENEEVEKTLEVLYLDENCDDPEFVRDLNDAPGLLALEMEEFTNSDGEDDMRGLPFIVPGGRFNELYYWDTYMTCLGLLLDDEIELVIAMIKHFCFCIRHYNKIPNANRTYYLGRSQPPFLTDLALQAYRYMKEHDIPGAKELLHRATCAAIKEYHNVWASKPRHDSESGLARFHPTGFGVPPETEASHFDHLLKPKADKLGMSLPEFIEAYNHHKVKDDELDEYFRHDRAARESGHDTSYRIERCCADLATIDLNSLLFKYEKDIEAIIRDEFDDKLSIPDEWLTDTQQSGHVETSAAWKDRHEKRRENIDKYLWNEDKKMYFDYNTVTKEQSSYESVTTLYPLWAGLVDDKRAQQLIEFALPKFEMFGGLVSGTEASRGVISLDRPNRQWDYPSGWAPHQILAWAGLLKYGRKDVASRVAYRWLYMILRSFRDFNGVVVEKYNVTSYRDAHTVTAEYGNQGADFKGVPKEGFGWVNASYVVGLSLMSLHEVRALESLATREQFSRGIRTGQWDKPHSISDDEGSIIVTGALLGNEHESLEYEEALGSEEASRL